MSIRIFKRGNVWHFRGTVAGRRLRGTTRTTEKQRAERIAAEVEARAWRRHLDGPAADLTFAQAAIAYRDAGKPTRFLERIEDYWRDTLVREITPGAVQQAARVLFPEGGPATRNRQVIGPTQAIINHAAALGWCSPIRVPKLRVATAERTPATLGWVREFAAQAEQDDLPHLAALALFMFGTGARIGEATALRWRDVDLAAGRAFIEQTKTSHSRSAHLHAEVIAAIANIPGRRHPDARVFGYAGRGSVSPVWRGVVARAGIEPLTPHSCRHGFATEMLRAGFDVKTVAALGGWKDATTVLRTYAHALRDPAATEALFDTDLTQRPGAGEVETSNARRKA